MRTGLILPWHVAYKVSCLPVSQSVLVVMLNEVLTRVIKYINIVLSTC